jgi:hypothetical protein
MDKSYPSKTPMVVQSLDVEKDQFRPRDNGEEILGSEVPYLSAIGALMYLANCTRPDIAFVVNLLARHSAAPTKQHWMGAKNIFRYLQGTKDLGLFFQFQKNLDIDMIGYTNAGYLSDPHNARSQTGFVFLHGGTAISWKSLFRNERMRIQRVILLIEVWVFIPCEQSPLRRFTSEGMPQIKAIGQILTAYS